MSILKDFMTKTVIPVVLILLSASVFKRFYVRDGRCDFMLMWVMVGIPFGITKVKRWYMVLSTNVASTVMMIALNIAWAGFIGGFLVIGKIVVAVYYIIRTFMRVVFRDNESIKRVYQNT